MWRRVVWQMFGANWLAQSSRYAIPGDADSRFVWNVSTPRCHILEDSFLQLEAMNTESNRETAKVRAEVTARLQNGTITCGTRSRWRILFDEIPPAPQSITQYCNILGTVQSSLHLVFPVQGTSGLSVCQRRSVSALGTTPVKLVTEVTSRSARVSLLNQCSSRFLTWRLGD